MIGALAFGLLIGLILGMVGGGGAVLAVPALVYAVGLDVHEATTASLRRGRRRRGERCDRPGAAGSRLLLLARL